MTDWTAALNLLQAHKQDLPHSTDAEKQAYIDEIRACSVRTNDDRRVAVQIAVDAVKTFVQIAIALVVAIVGFLQFSIRQLDTWQFWMLVTAVILAFVSMVAGFVAIARAFKRGDGLLSPSDIPWSTMYLKDQLNLQAWSGLIALIIFASILLFFSSSSVSRRMVITLPNGIAKTITGIEPLTVTGQWSALSIAQGKRFSLNLEAVPDKDSRSIRLEME